LITPDLDALFLFSLELRIHRFGRTVLPNGEMRKIGGWREKGENDGRGIQTSQIPERHPNISTVRLVSFGVAGLTK
jgi:hypothetical protein